MKTGNDSGANSLPGVLRDCPGLKPAQQLARPSARGEDKRARLVVAPLRLDLDTVPDRLPGSHGLILVQVCSELAGDRRASRYRGRP